MGIGDRTMGYRKRGKLSSTYLYTDGIINCSLGGAPAPSLVRRAPRATPPSASLRGGPRILSVPINFAQVFVVSVLYYKLPTLSRHQ